MRKPDPTTNRSSISRRRLLRNGATMVAGLPLAAVAVRTDPAATAPEPPAVHTRRHALFGPTHQPQEFSSRAIRLVEEATVMDMLCPLSIAGGHTQRWLADPSTFTSDDFDFYRGSGIDVFQDTQGGSGGRDAHERAIRWAAEWNGFLAYHHGHWLRITEPAHLDEINGSGKLGMILGLQNSSHFNTPDDVNLFHSLGQRISQLTYNSQNLIGTGAMEESDGGISDFGAEIVQRMNEVGMAVDVGHCGDQTTLDAFEISSKPVLITHSNARALNFGYARNKTDEAIRRMAESGGVMGMTAVRSFVSGEEPTTIEHLLDHYDHVARLVGVEHVGIGSDTDIQGGYDASPPERWARIGGRYRDQYKFRDKIDMDEMPTQERTFLLTEGLIRRGYNDEDIKLMLGGNFVRVLKEIWTT